MAVHYINPSNPRTNYNLKPESRITTFNKNELNLILSIYGKNVAQGIWKDYAIDHTNDNAVFSIYRNTFEKAFLSIKKNSSKIKRQKKYILYDANQSKIKDSDVLADLINQLKNKKIRVV